MRAHSTRVRLAVVLAATGLCTSAASAQNNANLPKIKPQVACMAMAGRAIAAAAFGLPTKGARLTTAELMPASGQGTRDELPEYCSVNGQIDPIDTTAPVINFRVNIPTEWNQMSWQLEGTGMFGIIPTSLARMLREGQQGLAGPVRAAYPPNALSPLARGFAIYGGDSGHQNQPQGQQAAPQAPGAGNAWMANKESLLNYGHAGLKKQKDAAMAVLKQMYGTEARVTLYAGNSMGGRWGLQAAGRYSADFDGIIAANTMPMFTGLIVEYRYRFEGQLEPGAWLPPAKRAAMVAEVIRQCDGLDGLEDGLASNYIDCYRRFDPTVTPNPFAHIRCASGNDEGDKCLSDKQLATINAWMSPKKYPFPLEGYDSWAGWPPPVGGPNFGYLFANAQPSMDNDQATNGALWGSIPRFVGGNVPGFDIRKTTLLDNRIAYQEFSRVADPPADWSGLVKNNTKFFMHLPTADYVSNTNTQIAFMQQAIAKAGGKPAFDRVGRVYTPANIDHQSGGISANGEPIPHHVDYLLYMENWVIKGVTPPDPIVEELQDLNAPYTVKASRPLCRFPQYPRYKGSGDPKTVASYTCASPSAATTTSSR